MADNIVVRIDVDTSEALAAMSAYEKSNQKVASALSRTTTAQARYDAAVQKSGAASQTAVVAQQKLGAAMARTVEAEKAAEIQALKLSEAQARQAAVANAAAEKQIAANTKLAASRKASAAAAVQSVTGFSAQTTGILAVAGAFAYAAKSAADFDAKMATLRSLAKDSTAGQLAQLREAAFGFTDLGISASEAADAEIELQKAGIAVKDQLGGALTGTLNLAAAGMMDVGEATEIAAKTMTAFALEGKDVPHIADLLAAGADKALGSVSDLGEGLKYAALPAHQLGLSVEETVGALAEFAQAGLLGSQGGTSLQMMLQRLIKPTAEAGNLMQQYGIHLYDAQGGFVGLADLAGQLHDKLGALTLEQRQTALATIFSARAARGAAILYQDGAEGVAAWAEKVDDAGFAADQASGKMDSLKGDVEKLGAAFKNAFTKGGEGLQTPLRNLVQALTALADLTEVNRQKTDNWLDDLKNGLKEFAVMSAWDQIKAGFSFMAAGPGANGNDPNIVPQGVRDAAAVNQAPIQLLGRVQGQVTDALAAAQVAVANSSRAMGGAMSETAGNAADYGDAIEETSHKTQTFAERVKAMDAALQASADALNQRAAMRDYAAAIKAVNQAQKSNKTTTTEMNEALDNQAAAALNLADDMGSGSAKQVAYLNRARDALYEQARQFGMTRDEADRYVSSVLRIPGEKNTHVNLYAEEAQARIDRLLASYNALRDKTVTVTADIRQTAGFTAGGHTVYGQAEGGQVYGKGTGTSDSNLRALSKGEFVVKTKSAQSIGYPAMDYINRTGQIPYGLAGGGRAGGGSPGGSSTRTVVMSDPSLLKAIEHLEDTLTTTGARISNGDELGGAVRQTAAAIAKGTVRGSAFNDRMNGWAT
jgi:TP901 family phage tail tape measure protein